MSNFEHYYTKEPKSKLKLYQIYFDFLNRSYIFNTATGVFSYKKVDKGTIVLLKSMIIPKKKNLKILDFGCGYGVIGIVLADKLPDSDILMIDTNKRAIWLAKKNIILNNIKNARAIYSDLFEKIDDKFDLIISNPPVSRGKVFLYKFFEEVYNYLNKGGMFQFVIRTAQGAKSAFEKIKEIFGEDNANLLKIKSGYRVYCAHKI